MIPNEIKINLMALSRSEKFHIIQFLLTELAREEEKELSHFFGSGIHHGFWSQYNASEAALKLQTLLETEV
jgi:hypothetical protein